MNRYQVNLALSTDKMLAYYEGKVKYIIARDNQGVRIQFPAEVLRQFVTSAGVYGNFSILVDENNKFVEISRVD